METALVACALPVFSHQQSYHKYRPSLHYFDPPKDHRAAFRTWNRQQPITEELSLRDGSALHKVPTGFKEFWKVALYDAPELLDVVGGSRD